METSLAIASGGVLVLAFPRAYAVGFSGFYLPLMMVLWLLVLRGLSIELRSHLENPLWRSSGTPCSAFASAVMAVVLGAALGNVLRGVPIDETGFFAVPLFTTFRPGRNPGVLDWYTVLIGVFAFAALAAHGALYLAGKTEGMVRERALAAARVAWPAVAAIGLGCIVCTWQVRPELYTGLAAAPGAGRCRSWRRRLSPPCLPRSSAAASAPPFSARLRSSPARSPRRRLASFRCCYPPRSRRRFR